MGTERLHRFWHPDDYNEKHDAAHLMDAQLHTPRTEPDLGVAFKNVPHVQCPARLFEPRQAPQVL